MALAPEISAFGDGSHDAGETGLVIDGGGFGAFPGSAWIFENDDLTGASDQLAVGTWNDIQLTGVDIPASPNNTSGTRYLFVQRDDLAWSNALAFTLNVGADRSVSATAAAITVTSLAASVGRGRGVLATAASISASAQAATVDRGRGVLAALEEISLSGQAATVVRGLERNVLATTSSITVTANAATVTRGVQIIFLSRDRIYTVRGPAPAVRVA